MNKSDKKLEKVLRETLTDVCEIALDSIPGFQWITHLVDYKRYPDSLKIIAVFKTETDIAHIKSHKEDLYLQSLITDRLANAAVQLKKPDKQILFDSEEGCDSFCDGDWAKRLSRFR